jgi:putative transposase
MAAREQAGREAAPSAGFTDSQSIKTTESSAICGYDAGEKVNRRQHSKGNNGRKRHIITDTCGFLVSVLVRAADIQDRDGAVDVPKIIRFRFMFLRHIFADGGHAGNKLKAALEGHGNWTFEIIKRPDTAKGFVLSPAAGWSNGALHGLAGVATSLKTGNAPSKARPHAVI